MILSKTQKEFSDATGAPRQTAVTIQRLVSASECQLAEPLLFEYLGWAASMLESNYGIRFDDLESTVQSHHQALAAEMRDSLPGRGRLLLARLTGEPAGVAALKPNGPGVAEIKRMFVRPTARGHGVARAILTHLIADARDEGFHVIRLETLSFMETAQALYESLGFVDCDPFPESELNTSGLLAKARYMELALA